MLITSENQLELYLINVMQYNNFSTINVYFTQQSNSHHQILALLYKQQMSFIPDKKI